MSNLKQTPQYQNALANYGEKIKSYLKKDFWSCKKDTLDGIRETMFLFGMTAKEETELIEVQRKALGLKLKSEMAKLKVTN